MSVTINNRTYWLENLSSAGVTQGQELPVTPVTKNENISAGNAQPENLERGTDTTGIPASASGTEIP